MKKRKKGISSEDWQIYRFKANALKSLAHPTRLAILDLLSAGEKCVCELIDTLELEQAIISKHLRVLKDSGIVLSEKKGLKIYYSIACPCISDLLIEISNTLKEIGRRQQRVLSRL